MDEGTKPLSLKQFLLRFDFPGVIMEKIGMPGNRVIALTAGGLITGDIDEETNSMPGAIEHVLAAGLEKAAEREVKHDLVCLKNATVQMANGTTYNFPDGLFLDPVHVIAFTYATNPVAKKQAA